MRLLRTAVIATALIAAPVAAVAVTAGPAAAHEHPTKVELVSPAVVRVETYAEVNISLIEHGVSDSHIGLHQKTYTPMLASGSGFAVDPTGGIVTSREVTDVDLRQAEIYAVNQIFHEQYGRAAPLPADPFTTHKIRGGDPTTKIAERLQQCYRPNRTDDSGGCVIFSKRVVKVLPFVSSQKKYGNLDATVVPLKDPAGDVVVLKVGASSMPAARLAATVTDAAFTVLGFTAVPSTGKSLRAPIGHFVKEGSTEFKRDEWYPTIVTDMAAGIAGGPVVGSASGQVLGFLVHNPGGTPSDLTMVGPAAIAKALEEARVKPQSGPTDAAYESALHNYKNGFYGASIPSLTQTVKLYPGHALATEALEQATRKKGTAEDLTGRAPQTAPSPPADRVDFLRTVLAIAVAAIAVIVLAVAIVLLLRRRQRSAPAAAADPASSPSPIMVPAPRQPSATRTDVATAQRRPTVLRPRPVSAGPTGAPRSADTGADCPLCGTQVAPGQTFCTQCGQRLR